MASLATVSSIRNRSWSATFAGTGQLLRLLITSIRDYRPPILLVLILILATLLRFVGLGTESLWRDEIDSVLTARLSLSSLLTEPTGNKQPLYFLALHFWTLVFGESETSVRFPSALMGLLTVIATYGLGKLVGNKWTGLGAAFLVAISPVMVWYSQETRMYTLTSFLLLSSSFCLLYYLKSARIMFLAIFTALTFLGLFTHYYYLPFVLAQGTGGAIWLWKDERRKDLRYLVAALIIASAALLSRFGVALQDFQNVNSTSFTVPVSTLLIHLTGAVGFEQPQKAITVWPITLFVWFALALGVAWAWRLRQRAVIVLLGIFLGSATLMLLGTATLDLPIVLRYFVPLVPIAYLLVAHGASWMTLHIGWRLTSRIRPSLVHATVATAMTVIVAGFAGVAWADELENTRKQQWRDVAAILEAEATPGDMLHIYPPGLQRQINFYSPKAMTSVTRARLSEPNCSNGRVWVIGIRRSGSDEAVKKLRDQGCPALQSITFSGGISLDLVGAAPDGLPKPARVMCAGLNPTIIGTDSDDILNGTPGDDVIHALDGNDTVNGGGGNDVFCGGSGNDKLNGGDGNDTLHGEEGHDTLNAAEGEDTLWGGPGDDILNAGEGGDVLEGGPGRDQLRGGLGDWRDILEGGPGDDTLTGGGGPDSLSGGPGVDDLNGGAGDDECLDVSAEDFALSCEI